MWEPTIVFCSSPTEGILFAQTFLTEADRESALEAFKLVMEMQKDGNDRSYYIGAMKAFQISRLGAEVEI
jgi:hypothetical protein